MKLGVRVSLDDPSVADWVTTVGEGAGLDSAWTSESYGEEAFALLAWVAARTDRIRLGTGIAAMPARKPATTAMAAMTLDHLSAGRTVVGLGTSSPAVSERWFGERYRRSLQGTREYVGIVRQAIRREQPLSSPGPTYPVPVDDGHDKGLRSSLRPFREDVPVYVGAQGPKQVALCAEIADGLLTTMFAPTASDWYEAQLLEGFRAAGLAAARPGFERVGIVDVRLADTVTEAADGLRATLATYIGVGTPGQGFYYGTLSRLGFAAECDRVLEALATGGLAAAAPLVPDELVEQVALVGPLEKVIDDLGRWAASCLDVVVLNGRAEHVVPVLDEALRRRR